MSIGVPQDAESVAIQGTWNVPDVPDAFQINLSTGQLFEPLLTWIGLATDDAMFCVGTFQGPNFGMYFGSFWELITMSERVPESHKLPLAGKGDTVAVSITLFSDQQILVEFANLVTMNEPASFKIDASKTGLSIRSPLLAAWVVQPGTIPTFGSGNVPESMSDLPVFGKVVFDQAKCVVGQGSQAVVQYPGIPSPSTSAVNLTVLDGRVFTYAYTKGQDVVVCRCAPAYDVADQWVTILEVDPAVPLPAYGSTVGVRKGSGEYDPPEGS